MWRAEIRARRSSRCELAPVSGGAVRYATLRPEPGHCCECGVAEPHVRGPFFPANTDTAKLGPLRVALNL
eukprot:36223-Chlamydomonas_euryale.AAC.4